MKASSIVNAVAFVAAASAQSSPRAPYNVANYFPVVWNDSTTVEPGMLFQPTEVVNEPSYGAGQTNTSAEQPYLVIFVDVNVVPNKSNGIESEYLHQLQPNLYFNNTNRNLTFNASGPNAASAVGAPWFPPQPLPNDLHNYNWYLFKQPHNFTFPSNFTAFNSPTDINARLFFNTTQFVTEAGLGSPLAANYIRVLNGSSAETSAVITQTATSGVAFSSGFEYPSYTEATTTTDTTGGTTLTGTHMSTTGVRTSTATITAPTPSATTSGATDSSTDIGVMFVKAVCAAVAVTIPWIW